MTSIINCNAIQMFVVFVLKMSNPKKTSLGTYRKIVDPKFYVYICEVIV